MSDQRNIRGKSAILPHMSEDVKKVNRRVVKAIILSFIAGVLWLVAMRFVTLKNNEVHYHANFALFINGERYTFDRFSYYEEVQLCGGPQVSNPKTRTHMHDRNNHIVHVHDNAVTWGDFFANLGMVDGDTVFKTDDKTYVEDDKTQIKFILNGKEVDTTANRTIESKDVLLVSIGAADDAELQKEYAQIPQDADEFNKKNDPASCSGGERLTTKDRLKKAIGIFGD